MDPFALTKLIQGLFELLLLMTIETSFLVLLESSF